MGQKWNNQTSDISLNPQVRPDITSVGFVFYDVNKTSCNWKWTIYGLPKPSSTTAFHFLEIYVTTLLLLLSAIWWQWNDVLDGGFRFRSPDNTGGISWFIGILLPMFVRMGSGELSDSVRKVSSRRIESTRLKNKVSVFFADSEIKINLFLFSSTGNLCKGILVFRCLLINRWLKIVIQVCLFL